MKKIVFLAIVGIVLMGCASIPLTPSGESIEGVWVKEDGTKLTIENGKWELVSVEDGVAGYGSSYKFRKDGKLGFTIDLMINLKAGEVVKDSVYPAPIKPFQKEARETYRELYPDRILTLTYVDSGFNGMFSGYSKGGSVHDFVLTGDTLFLSESPESPPPTGRMFYTSALSGTFTRVN